MGSTLIRKSKINIDIELAEDDDMRMISNLLSEHEQIIKTLRKDEDYCEDKYHYMKQIIF